MRKSSGIILSLIVLFVGLLACEEEFSPKPKAYFRIDFEEKTYTNTSVEDCQMSFDIPQYALVREKEDRGSCWFDVYFPPYRAVIHHTYKPLDENLHIFTEETYTLAMEHYIKANQIKTIPIEHPEKDVYGLLYDLQGDVASPMQYYLTDSVNHFVRGSFYFNVKTNEDSLRPVKQYLREDVERLLNSFEWN